MPATIKPARATPAYMRWFNSLAVGDRVRVMDGRIEVEGKVERVLAIGGVRGIVVGGYRFNECSGLVAAWIFPPTIHVGIIRPIRKAKARKAK